MNKVARIWRAILLALHFLPREEFHWQQMHDEYVTCSQCGQWYVPGRLQPTGYETEPHILSAQQIEHLPPGEVFRRYTTGRLVLRNGKPYHETGERVHTQELPKIALRRLSDGRNGEEVL